MKPEAPIIAFLMVCLALTFYFTFVSLQTTDDVLRKELVSLAAYSLVTGAVVLATALVYLGIKQTLSSIEEQTNGSEETETTENP